MSVILVHFHSLSPRLHYFIKLRKRKLKTNPRLACKMYIEFTMSVYRTFFIHPSIYFGCIMHTFKFSTSCLCSVDIFATTNTSYRTNVVVAFFERQEEGSKLRQRSSTQNGENTGVALAMHRWSRRCYSVGVTVASGSERWSRKDTSIPTQSLSPLWIAASTPDTVPASPCPVIKRLQPPQQRLCNV